MKDPTQSVENRKHWLVKQWSTEWPDVKNYKWRLNPVWHRMIYSCSHMATAGVKGLNVLVMCLQHFCPITIIEQIYLQTICPSIPLYQLTASTPQCRYYIYVSECYSSRADLERKHWLFVVDPDVNVADDQFFWANGEDELGTERGVAFALQTTTQHYMSLYES